MRFRTVLKGKTKDGYHHQFSVALEEDDGTPLLVSLGWRLANLTSVIPPTTRSKTGYMFSIVELPNPEFVEKIKESILKKIDPSGALRDKQEYKDSKRAPDDLL